MRSSAGLSLFELLVSLALLAMISAGLAGALGVTIRTHDRATAVPESNANPISKARLRRWLAQAVPPNRLASFPVTFDGAPQRLEFTTLAAKGFAPDAGALRITVTSESEALLLSVTTLDDDGAAIATLEQDIVIGGVSEFEYFDPSDDSPGWVPIWQNKADLPAMVRITMPEARNTLWADFTVRLFQQ
ncbi:prepilin-type N-terminal cleavage/methylation domain-containing protein [Thalassococcus sp. BH17M4-6]|uniref:prepilin-type N-terminal cleavage/methylation domain-containing protein n=1 Tax=Thalassococcus sp. BH17M4-6 TaxID=3413148 RepID=UPI003BC67E69